MSGLVCVKYSKLPTIFLKNRSSIFDVPSLIHNFSLVFVGVEIVLQFSMLNFSIFDIVDLLSQKINVGLDGIKFNSSIILLIQIACCDAHDAEIYFASENDKSVVSGFFEFHATLPDPKLNTYPIVLFLSSHDPAQHCYNI